MLGQTLANSDNWNYFFSTLQKNLLHTCCEVHHTEDCNDCFGFYDEKFDRNDDFEGTSYLIKMKKWFLFIEGRRLTINILWNLKSPEIVFAWQVNKPIQIWNFISITYKLHLKITLLLLFSLSHNTIDILTLQQKKETCWKSYWYYAPKTNLPSLYA